MGGFFIVHYLHYLYVRGYFWLYVTPLNRYMYMYIYDMGDISEMIADHYKLHHAMVCYTGTMLYIQGPHI